MKLSDQVCSIELAKKLKELGVKQESYFIHWKNKYMDDDAGWYLDALWEVDDEERFDQISAFTVAELGEMLPDNVYTQKDCAELKTTWSCHRVLENGLGEVWVGDTEANTRALMLHYLIEQGLIPTGQTKYLLQSPANAARLYESFEQIARGEFVEGMLDES